jgi:hypothetical protein
MHQYPRLPMNSPVDRLQKAVCSKSSNLSIYFSSSYHAVVLMHIQIGFKHLMVMHFIKYRNHVVKDY